MTHRTLLAMLAALTLPILLARPAMAQHPGSGHRRSAAAASSPHPAASEGPVINVVGRLQRPVIFAVSGRGVTPYLPSEDARHFAPLVLSAVHTTPF